MTKIITGLIFSPKKRQNPFDSAVSAISKLFFARQFLFVIAFL